jgi:trans-aconitate 2-methyltransferase
VSEALDWDARTYDRVSTPQQSWAEDVLERLPLRGDEVVLDAGCGSGRVTAALLERLPRGRVYAVDASRSMVEQARAALDDRATVLCQDLLELDLPEPVDAVISTATFHWIADHDRLFARMYDVLRPGGRLVAQFGGEGNIARFHALADEIGAEPPFGEHFAGWEGPWNFQPADATATRLKRIGFTDVEAWLEPRPTRPPEPRAFIRTVCVAPHLERLPELLRDPFLDALLERSGKPLELDYVRLNVTAGR